MLSNIINSNLLKDKKEAGNEVTRRMDSSEFVQVNPYEKLAKKPKSEMKHASAKNLIC